MSHEYLQAGDYVVLGYTPAGEHTVELYRSGYVLATAQETTSGLPHINVLMMGGVTTVALNPEQERVVAVIRDGLIWPPAMLDTQPVLSAAPESEPEAAPAPKEEPESDRAPKKTRKAPAKHNPSSDTGDR